MLKRKKTLVISILIVAYFIITTIFFITTFHLQDHYTKIEKDHIESVAHYLNKIFEDFLSEEDLLKQLPKFVKDNTMEMVVIRNGENRNEVIFKTIDLTAEQLRDYGATDVFLSRTQLIFIVDDIKYIVSYNLYHVQIPKYVNKLSQLQIKLIAIAFLLLFTIIALIQYILIRPLVQIKSNLDKIEDYNFEEVLEMPFEDDINEKLHDFVSKLHINMKNMTHNFTELEQALQIERECLNNTITVSRAFIHDLKSPLHQTMLENELMLSKIKNNSMRSILIYNIERSETTIQTINDILKIMDENPYNLNKIVESVELCKLLTDTRIFFQASIQKKELYVEMEIPESCIVKINFATIKLLLHNIFSNATQYAKNNSEIVCEIMEVENGVVITCQNESTHENVKRMQSSASLFNPKIADENIISSGKGLFLIKELTYILGGQYELSIENTEVKVIISLPLPSSR